jgi:hypothetical protein
MGGEGVCIGYGVIPIGASISRKEEISGEGGLTFIYRREL